MESKKANNKTLSDYIGMGTLIGFCTAIGAVLGAILGNFVFWLMGGAALGVVVGAIIEVQRKRITK